MEKMQERITKLKAELAESKEEDKDVAGNLQTYLGQWSHWLTNPFTVKI